MKYLISSQTLIADFNIHQIDQACGICLVVIFKFLSSLLCLLEHFCKKRYSFPYSCIYSFFYIGMDSQKFFILSSNPILLFLILLLKLFQLCPLGTSSHWFLCLFDMFPSLCCFLSFWHHRIPQAHLYFPCSTSY